MDHKPCVWRFLIMSKLKISAVIDTNTTDATEMSATGTKPWIEKLLQSEVFHIFRAFSLLGG